MRGTCVSAFAAERRLQLAACVRRDAAGGGHMEQRGDRTRHCLKGIKAVSEIGCQKFHSGRIRIVAELQRSRRFNGPLSDQAHEVHN
jgi:hypothetical protein